MLSSMYRRRSCVRLVLICAGLGLAWMTLPIQLWSKIVFLVRPLDSQFSSDSMTMGDSSKSLAGRNTMGESIIEVEPINNSNNHSKGFRNNSPNIVDGNKIKIKDSVYEYHARGNRNTQRTYKKGQNPIESFGRLLSPGEKAILLNLSSIVVDVIDSLHAPYMMYGGTLLGSYRHHDIIPWDDDIDFLVTNLARDDLYRALLDLGPFYKTVEIDTFLKFFGEMPNRTSKRPWGWPFIDIFFYKENGTHIWDSSDMFSNDIYPKGDIFPTHERPLAHLKFQAPRDTLACLRSTYNTLCQTPRYNHRTEMNKTLVKSVPCEVFRDSLPFVHRHPAPGGVRETLMLGDMVMYSLVVEEPSSAINYPFSLNFLGQ